MRSDPSNDDSRPGVGTVVASVCVGVVGVVWGLIEYLWGNPALGVFAFVGVFTIFCAADYYFRVARHL